MGRGSGGLELHPILQPSRFWRFKTISSTLNTLFSWGAAINRIALTEQKKIKSKTQTRKHNPSLRTTQTDSNLIALFSGGRAGQEAC